MRTMGYPTVPGSKTFFSDAWGKAIGSPRRNIDAAYRYAKKLGFPVIVKPNSGSQGKGVALVHTRQELYAAVRAVFRHDRIVIVQRPVRGRDYRIVVLDDEAISAYERIRSASLATGSPPSRSSCAPSKKTSWPRAATRSCDLMTRASA